MNLLSKIAIALSLLFTFTSCTTQLQNAKTESVKIYGNCGVCETAIEKAGNLKNEAQVDWNKDTKWATLTYDTIKTNQNEILKRIALAGFDSDLFLAPKEKYGNLTDCCHYDRKHKSSMGRNMNVETNSMQNHLISTEIEQEINQLDGVFENYFTLKDALVNSDPNLASSIAKNLLSKIKEVKMEKLSLEEHTVWMKVTGSLNSNTEVISNSTDIEKQRKTFMNLTANVYDLMKVSKQDASIYYQHCPMYNDGKGSNWLSKENEIKNPYYGSKMLNCGKTLETIK